MGYSPGCSESDVTERLSFFPLSCCINHTHTLQSMHRAHCTRAGAKKSARRQGSLAAKLEAGYTRTLSLFT